MDNLVQTEDSRTTGRWRRQRNPWGSLLWGPAEENKVHQLIQWINFPDKSFFSSNLSSFLLKIQVPLLFRI